MQFLDKKYIPSNINTILVFKINFNFTSELSRQKSSNNGIMKIPIIV